ncbi:hypothetical protein LTR84_005356 [Exophiala bonariae]|uniref:Uncharacterized protein n=1 Tax=Exophiala bonariae TaxID=1690606 RepID=A0AAV9N3H6_9EURO|nr:hypothetical protein LTR84_005356 [Exophiala bonariae]
MMITAYRDSSKLVQRLRDKQTNSKDFILPEDLTKEFDESLLLGCAAVQSQYDHDVRRFGETYVRGDAVAREQMKDILITLQQNVISHLREVFMDEASLNLHALKETSDDCRVNATVSLGQLYQRMSTATAAVKQLHRPYVDEPDKVHLQGSLAYSSSRSTHSSFGGRPYDAQSSTSYTTYSSKTAIGHDRKPSGGFTPQRRISMNSAMSYSSERDRDRPQMRTPGEDNVPALPFPMQRQASQGPLDSASTGSGRFPSNIDTETASNPSSPPPYAANSFIHTTDDKGQKFPPGSSFYEPPVAEVPENAIQSPIPTLSPGMAQVEIRSRAIHIHELDDNSKDMPPHSTDQDSSVGSPSIPQSQLVPLNPEYSTLEYVAALESRSRPPAALAASVEYQQYMQAMNMQNQLRPQPLFSQGVVQQRQSMIRAESFHTSPMQSHLYNGQYPPVAQNYSQPLVQSQFVQPYRHVGTGIQQQQPPPSQTNFEVSMTNTPATIDPLLQAKVPSIPASNSRPLSIRSTASTGSRLASFALRKALPPGIVEAINKPAPHPQEEQPRYIKPKALDLTQSDRSSTTGSNPTSPIARHMNTLSLDEKPRPPSSNAPSLESTMRAVAPSSSSIQIARSELNLPSEANLGGFCKGAVRQQLGGRKKGFGVESKKGGKAGQEFCFRCTKCNFEGPAVVSAALPSGGRGAVKREKTMDTKVRTSGAIRYRWAFLAKSHILNKTANSDATNGNDAFGCYFCCAEGAAKGWLDDGGAASQVHAQLATLGTFGGNKPTTAAHVTPTFHGLKAFMAHLETHRLSARLPGLVAANEMNCIIGRVALDTEDFDLNLPPLAS